MAKGANLLHYGPPGEASPIEALRGEAGKTIGAETLRLSILIVCVLAACAPFEPGQRVQTATYATGSNIPKESSDAVVMDKDALNDAALKNRVPGKLDTTR